MSERPGRRERIADAKRRVEILRATAEARLEHERAHRSWIRLIVRSWERDRDRAGGLLAGGVAYRIFLWQLPAALVIVAVTGALSIATDADPGQVMQDAGLTAAVAAGISQAATDTGAASWWLLFLGLWGMLWAGRGAARAVQVVSRIAFETNEPPRATAAKASLTFNGLMLVALLTQAVSNEQFGDHVVGKALLLLLSSLLLFTLLLWAMSLLPRGERSWRVVIPGAVLFTLGVLAMRVAIEVYFAARIDRVEDIYGSIGIAVVILLGLYVTARMFVWAVFGSATFAGVGGQGESFDVLGAVGSYGSRLIERGHASDDARPADGATDERDDPR